MIFRKHLLLTPWLFWPSDYLLVFQYLSLVHPMVHRLVASRISGFSVQGISQVFVVYQKWWTLLYSVMSQSIVDGSRTTLEVCFREKDLLSFFYMEIDMTHGRQNNRVSALQSVVVFSRPIRWIHSWWFIHGLVSRMAVCWKMVETNIIAVLRKDIIWHGSLAR